MAKNRERIEPNESDKRFVRRDEQGQFIDDQENVGRSLTQDRTKEAKSTTKKGQGDRGDRAERGSSSQT
jgi:hypothetical protein